MSDHQLEKFQNMMYICIFNSKLLDIKRASFNDNIYSLVVNEFYHHIFDIKQILLLYILLLLK